MTVKANSFRQRVLKRPGIKAHLVLWGCIGLIVLTLAVYIQVVGFDYVQYDDELYVTENHQVQSGLSLKNIAWAFSTLHAANWHPVTWLSHMLDVEFYGLNPGGHHLTNVILHILNSMLLFGLLKRMTGSFWRSWQVAALFALHPLHAESVAWISERKDVLSFFFAMLTLWSYAYYVEHQSVKRYLAVLFSFALGLMTKPMLVTLPCVLLLLDYWPLGRINFESWRDFFKPNHQNPLLPMIWEKAPLFLLVLLSCGVTFFAQQKYGAVSSLYNISLEGRFLNSAVGYIQYLAKMVWPEGLCAFYPYSESISLWKAAGAALLLLSLSIAALWISNKAAYITVGWFWYLGTLVPVIGLIQVGAQSMADRYTYLPLVGIFILLVWGLAEIGPKWVRWRKFNPIAVILILGLLSFSAYHQVGYWKNSEKLFRRMLDQTHKNNVGHSGLAVVLEKQGLISEAVLHIEAALKIVPNNPLYLTVMGGLLHQKGEFSKAIRLYEKALKLNPDLKKTHNNLGNALVAQKKYQEAIPHFEDALHLDPDYVAAHNNFGIALIRANHIGRGVWHFREALRINPRYENARINLQRITKGPKLHR